MNKLSMLRLEAKKNGLTFKKVNEYWNGAQAYGLFNRETGVRVGCSSGTLNGWFENEQHQGVISNYAV